jgi:hypothetical protein
MDNKKINIHSGRVAGWLMFNRIPPEYIRTDMNDQDRYIYEFEVTPNLSKYLREYSKNKERVS